MYSKKKKILSSLLLAAVVVTTAITSLTACADDTNGGGTATTTVSNDQQPPTDNNGENGNGGENGVREYVSSAPIFDWEGRDFRILTNPDDGGEWRCVDWTAEELLGEPINDAIVMRNLAIGDMFNLNIVAINESDRAGRVRTSVTAGDNAFEIAFNPPHAQSNLAQQGMLWDLFEVPHLSLHEPWWDQNAVADLSITNRLFSVVGDIGTMYRMSVGAYASCCFCGFGRQWHMG